MKQNQVPTIVCNRFMISAGGILVRIAFGEQVQTDGDIEYHSSIVLTKTDALELAALINKAIAATENLEQGVPDKGATIN